MHKKSEVMEHLCNSTKTQNNSRGSLKVTKREYFGGFFCKITILFVAFSLKKREKLHFELQRHQKRRILTFTFDHRMNFR